MNSSVAEQWIQATKELDWDGGILTQRDYQRAAQLPRLWKRVLDVRNLAPDDAILEVGCGAGTQLIPFAVQGFAVTGIDVSPDAIEQFHYRLAQIEKFQSRPLSVDLLIGDYAQMRPTKLFPLVFSFGVIEHFLARAERLEFLQAMCAWTKPGGVCVNFVPNGQQPLREKMRAEKLGGYDIPEIDYSSALLHEELRQAGFVNPRVVPLDLFGYRLVLTRPRTFKWWSYRALNLCLKIFPHTLLPFSFRERHAYILASVAEKPER